MWVSFFGGLVCLLIAGCVQQSQFVRFQNDVRSNLDRNEAAIDIFKKDIYQLHSSHEKEKQAWKKRDDDLNRRLADLSANFDELKLEIAAIDARLDEGKHYSQISTNEIKGLRKGLSSQIAEFEQKLANIEKGLVEQKKITQGPPPASHPSKPSSVTKPESAKKPPVETPTPSPGDDLTKYKEAKFKFDEGDYKEALDAFQRFLKTFPKSKLADNAQFWLAECYYREGVYEKAIVEYEKVISEYPKGGKIPSALLKQAMAFQKLDDKESARFLYQKVIKEFPKASQAVKARYELKRLK